MYPPLLDCYARLFARWGEQHWWPADSDTEMIIGAVLTQNTAWTNVEKAMDQLRLNKALDFRVIHRASHRELAEWIRSAGFFNQKAKTLKGIAKTLSVSFEGQPEKLFELDTPALRCELLSWCGIGPETADCILLYAARRPAFVVDAYTRRFLNRHGWCDAKASYNAVATLFTDQLPPNAALFNEYHALIVQLGKEHCKTKPQCAGCPLEYLLPPNTSH